MSGKGIRQRHDSHPYDGANLGAADGIREWYDAAPRRDDVRLRDVVEKLMDIGGPALVKRDLFSVQGDAASLPIRCG